MVKSTLDSTIIYPESKNTNVEDKNYNAQMYEIAVFSGKVINIVLGQPKYIKKIIYYPIYLTVNDKVVMQIGVYELLAADLPKLIDADGDVDLELINEPLLYAFTTPEEIQRLIAPANAPANALVEKQTAESANKERMEYKKNGNKMLWIQKFMQSSNYRIIDNEGNGECLFAVIRDGLKGKVELSVEEIRQLLAAEVDAELYKNYLELYQNAKSQDQVYMNESKGLVQRNKELKERLNSEKDRNKQMTIISQAEEVSKRHELVANDRKYTRAMLLEFAFMKNVKSIEDLRAKIQTCEFWGNTWAISTLERVLNIKLIILSEEYFKDGDINNVLQCGQLNDDKLAEFNPNHYILTCFQGNHYQLITYKEQMAFTFQEVPYDIKMLVVNKCMERLAGPYYIIPDFRVLYEDSAGIQLHMQMERLHIATINESKKLTEKIQPQTELYDNSTVFQFYAKSSDKPLPGYGVGEQIQQAQQAQAQQAQAQQAQAQAQQAQAQSQQAQAQSQQAQAQQAQQAKYEKYKDLAKIKSWRRKLANEWESPFKLDGHLWQTVEHYYQGSKFKKENRDFYLQFSLDSGSEIAKNPELAKEAGKKGYIPIKGKEPAVKVSADSKTSSKDLEDALRAKFTQNPELTVLLNATKKAKLQYFRRGKLPVICDELMRVRKEIVVTTLI